MSQVLVAVSIAKSQDYFHQVKYLCLIKKNVQRMTNNFNKLPISGKEKTRHYTYLFFNIFTDRLNQKWIDQWGGLGDAYFPLF